MSAIKESEYEAQKALIDFYNNLANKYKWRKLEWYDALFPVNWRMDQYLKQYSVPKLVSQHSWVGSKDGIRNRDVFFYSGGYLGYDLAYGGGGYVKLRDIGPINEYIDTGHPAKGIEYMGRQRYMGYY